MAVQEKIKVKIRSYEHTLADQAAAKIVDIAKRNGAEVSGPIPLPTEKEIITILRAVHKYKDSVNSSSRGLTRDLLRYTSLHRKSSRLSPPSNFLRESISKSNFDPKKQKAKPNTVQSGTEKASPAQFLSLMAVGSSCPLPGGSGAKGRPTNNLHYY